MISESVWKILRRIGAAGLLWFASDRAVAFRSGGRVLDLVGALCLFWLAADWIIDAVQDEITEGKKYDERVS